MLTPPAPRRSAAATAAAALVARPLGAVARRRGRGGAGHRRSAVHRRRSVARDDAERRDHYRRLPGALVDGRVAPRRRAIGARRVGARADRRRRPIHARAPARAPRRAAVGAARRALAGTPGQLAGARFEAPGVGGRRSALVALAALAAGRLPRAGRLPSATPTTSAAPTALLRERRPLQRARPRLPVAPPLRAPPAGDRAERCVRATCAANPVVALARGRRPRLPAARRTGGVTCWGRNGDGQLGDGTLTPRSFGVRVAGLTDAVAIAAGERHTCAVRAGGAVVCWGADDTGQLGDGGGPDRLTPVPVPGVAGAVGSRGRRRVLRARCWRDGTARLLGRRPRRRARRRRAVAAPRAPTPVLGARRARAAVGALAARLRDPQPTARWSAGATTPGAARRRHAGQPAAAGRGRRAYSASRAVATGLSHTCALSAARAVRAGAATARGSSAPTRRTSTTPVTAPMPVPLVAEPDRDRAPARSTPAPSAAPAPCCCWGQNSTGQLGEGSMSSLAVPVPVDGLDTGRQVAAGATFSCAAHQRRGGLLLGRQPLRPARHRQRRRGAPARRRCR